MAASGIYAFQLTRDDIINAALRKLVVVSEGQTANAAQLVTGGQALNALTASFQTLGMLLWVRRELSIPMVVAQQAYTIGIGMPINQPFPIHIHEAVLTTSVTTSQIDVTMLSRKDFNLLPRTTGGTQVNATYQPFVNYGVLSVWPIPDASMAAGTALVVTHQIPFQYFIGGTDTADFPQEWALPLIYGLASLLAPENGIPFQDRQMLMSEAAKYLKDVLENGAEDGSVFFGKG